MLDAATKEADHVDDNKILSDMGYTQGIAERSSISYI